MPHVFERVERQSILNEPQRVEQVQRRDKKLVGAFDLQKVSSQVDETPHFAPLQPRQEMGRDKE